VARAVVHPKLLAVRMLLEIFFWLVNFHLKMQNLGLKIPLLEIVSSKIAILSPHYLVCWNFATVCWNSVRNLQCLCENCNILLAPPFFKIPQRCCLRHFSHLQSTDLHQHHIKTCLRTKSCNFATHRSKISCEFTRDMSYDDFRTS